MQTVYFDTANWYDLAENNSDRQLLENSVKAGLITPVVSHIHLMEFARRGKAERERVVGCIESLQRAGSMKWVATLRYLVAQEVQNSYCVAMGVSGRAVVALFDSHRAIPDLNLPWQYRWDPNISLGGLVEHFATSPRNRYEQLRSHPAFNFPFLRTWQTNSRRLAKPNFVIDLAEQVLRSSDSITTNSNIELPPPDSDQIKDFRRNFDLSRCPALSLLIAFIKGWSLTSGGESGSEADDCFHLAGLAYSDLGFSDKRTRDALSKDPQVTLPKNNSEFNNWLRDLI